MFTILNQQQTFTLRYPESSDWRKLWIFINNLSKDKTFITYQGQTISQTQEKLYLKQKLEAIKQHRSVQLVLETSDHLIVGSVNLDLKERVEDHVGIIGISLLPDFRNRGLGFTMLDQLLNLSKTHLPKLKLACLNVMSTNQHALQLYKKYGFIESGRLPNGIRHRGKFVDHIQMYKIIN